MIGRKVLLAFSVVLLVSVPAFEASASQTAARRNIFEFVMDRAYSANTNPEIIQVSNDGKTGIEKLEGEPARAHLQNLKAKRKGAFEKAAEVLERKGFKKTDNVVVFRSVSMVNGRAISKGQYALVEDAFSSADGELVFWSWDDGDDSTWEGAIYMAAYAEDADLLTDTQMNIAVQEFYPLWEDLVFWNRPTGPRYQTASLELQAQPIPQVACNSGDVIRQVARSAEANGLVVPAGWGDAAKTWAKCTAAGCAGAATACWLSGPGWGHCTGAWCAGTAVGCGVAVVLNKMF